MDSVEVCVIALPHLLILGKCYAVHITHLHYNESVHRKKQHTPGNNTIPYKLASLMTFESLKWKYSFATNVLIVTRDESPLVYRAPDSHFGTFHIGTSTIRDCTKFCTISSYYEQAVRTERRYKRQFGSNSLLFTLFKTV